MVKRLILLVCLPALACAEGFQLRPGMTGVADLGSIPCEMYNRIYPNGPTGLRQATLYYAEGYIYARSGKGIDEVLRAQGGSWDFDSLTDIVVDYCAANPDVPVQQAIEELANNIL